MRQIKRYPNRKLYDTGEKRYVTLSDIAHFIRDGDEVQVMDHSSGEDLTAITLTQIIFEQEKRQAGFLPRSVLVGLIQSGGERLSTLRRTLALPLGLRHYVDAEIERRIRALVAAGVFEVEDARRLRASLLEKDATGVEYGEETEPAFDQFLDRFGVPSKDDIVALERQLKQLDHKIEALLSGNS